MDSDAAGPSQTGDATVGDLKAEQTDNTPDEPTTRFHTPPHGPTVTVSQGGGSTVNTTATPEDDTARTGEETTRSAASPHEPPTASASPPDTVTVDGADAHERGSVIRYFGDYVLLEKIGRGGMGVVYKARQISLNRLVALKMLKTDVMATEDERRRFQNEAEAVALLDHPRIVPILEVGDHKGHRYFSMKLIDGPSLGTKLAAYVSDPKAAARLVATVAEAVHHAHQRGVLHRDLKPANILLDEHSEPHVGDFGLARRVEGDSELTHSGVILGTPSYMAPEQASGRRGAVSTASDIYGLGAVLYAVLTGRAPFRGDSVADTLQQVRDRPVEPPSRVNGHTPRDLEVICLKCLEKEPPRRYDSAQALADDLRRWHDGRPIMARSAGWLELLWLLFRRNPALAATGVLAAAALVATATIATVFAVQQTQYASRRAEAARTERLLRENITKAYDQASNLLVRMATSEGERHASAGDLFAAMPWFTDPLVRVPNNFEEIRSVRARFEAYLQYTPHYRLTAMIRADDLAATGIRWSEGPRLVNPIGPNGEVKGLQVKSPDGSRIVKADEKYAVRVWDTVTGLTVSPPLRHEGRISYAVFSPDAKLLLTTSDDKTARLWVVASGQPLTPALLHGGVVSMGMFSPDGRRVATVSGLNTVRVWDATFGQPMTPLLRHGEWVSEVLFSEDSRLLLTITTNGIGRVWDAAVRQPVKLLVGHTGWVRSALCSANGQRVVTASTDGTARVWDAVTGKQVCPPLQHEGVVITAFFSADGRQVVTASVDGTARVWDAASGKQVLPPLRHTAEVRYATFSADGRRVLTASSDNSARIWDAATGQPVAPPMLHGRMLHSAQFSPDGQRVVTASADSTALIWKAATGDAVGTPLSHAAEVRFASFSPDGRWVVTASSDKTARVWDATSGQPVTSSLRHEGIVMSAVFSPDGKKVLTACRDNTARQWEVATGKPVGRMLSHQGGVYAASFSPDGRWVVTGSGDHTARVWNSTTGEPITPPLQHGNTLGSASFSPDGERVMTASGDQMARIWSLPRRELPNETLTSIAQVLSSQRLDQNGLIIPLSSEEVLGVWSYIGEKSNELYEISAEEVREWHRKQVDDAERDQAWFAMGFHLKCLIKYSPGDVNLQRRLTDAADRLEAKALP
jgi:WD40 repeat protein/tRNA A-37 threonylcarbamoyl transferase component Bud32